MKLSALKSALKNVETLKFQLPNGKFVPAHFHLTEMGKISNEFIDCGGTLRNEEVISLQLWTSIDYLHRLSPQKFLEIIALAEKTLHIDDVEIEVEYQAETIGKYGLEFNGKHFLLTGQQTECLASDICKIPVEKTKVQLSKLVKKPSFLSMGNCCS